MNVQRKDVVKAISKKTRISKTEVDMVLVNFFDVVINNIKEGNNVYLRKFGTFERKTRKEKKCRDIKRNTMIVVPEHDIFHFRPSKGIII